MGGDDYVSLRSEVEFLLERLDELELDDTPEDFVRDWYGHVAPPLERVRAMLSAAPPSPRSEMREALEAARQFIVNGVELGYICIPKNDPAEHTLGKINAALKES